MTLTDLAQGVNGRGRRAIKVLPDHPGATIGWLSTGLWAARCALGRSGTTANKREGDGATPTGRMALVSVFYRPDRGPRPRTALPVMALAPDRGWCDDPASPLYNRQVRLPFAGRHEKLWRDDRLYDVVVVLDYNLAPVRRGAGSAIFLHIATPVFSPTEGCVAVTPETMRRLLAVSRPGSYLDVGR